MREPNPYSAIVAALGRLHSEHVGQRGDGCHPCWKRRTDYTGCDAGNALRAAYHAARECERIEAERLVAAERAAFSK